MSDIDDLWQRVGSLERRLNRYHEWLESSIDQRTTFNLKATWGILHGVIGWGAFAGSAYLLNDWFGPVGWLGGVGIIAAAFAAMGYVVYRTNRSEEDDHKKLDRLPQWDEIE